MEKTFVLSQIKAFTPGFAISAQSTGSQGSPTRGVSSSLKSPVWTIRPAGVSIQRPELSGIEWLIGKNPTLKGPISTLSGQGATIVNASAGTPCSSSFRRAMFAVNALAYIGGAPSCLKV